MNQAKRILKNRAQSTLWQAGSNPKIYDFTTAKLALW
jgi:hypothetical protein